MGQRVCVHVLLCQCVSVSVCHWSVSVCGRVCVCICEWYVAKEISRSLFFSEEYCRYLVVSHLLSDCGVPHSKAILAAPWHHWPLLRPPSLARRFPKCEGSLARVERTPPRRRRTPRTTSRARLLSSRQSACAALRSQSPQVADKHDSTIGNACDDCTHASLTFSRATCLSIPGNRPSLFDVGLSSRTHYPWTRA